MAVELKKGQKISLEKKSGVSLGEITINLNWNQGEHEVKKSFLSTLFKPRGVDLDLGCLYELSDGAKGCVQALGNAFGNYNEPPYIVLDKDDRTGSLAEGENLRVNGNMIAKFRRILVYTFIYEGVPNWQQVDGVVTVRYPGSQDIIVHMDEYDSLKTLCGITLFENINNETFSVEKVIQFFDNQAVLDKAFSWGMRWTEGRKN
ncbi:MAG: TerD family protein [Treponema sp.]|nr:TerD family protein [Treponema sp.]